MDLDRAASAKEEVGICNIFGAYKFWDFLKISKIHFLQFQDSAAGHRLASAPTRMDSAIQQAEILVDSAAIRPALAPSQVDLATLVAGAAEILNSEAVYRVGSRVEAGLSESGTNRDSSLTMDIASVDKKANSPGSASTRTIAASIATRKDIRF